LKEKRKFLIKANIKDNDGRVKLLSKEQELEIEWVDSFDEKEGILNPGEVETYTRFDGTKGVCRKSQGEIVQFEEGEKKYEILVKFAMKKGFFKDRLSSLEFEPKQPDFSIHYVREEGGGERHELFDDGGKGSGGSVNPSYQRSGGRILLIIGVIAAFLIGGIVAFMLWKKKPKK